MNKPIPDQLDDILGYHYIRLCTWCGTQWAGLHCPHDGYQNPCPTCHKKPLQQGTDCDCEFTFFVDKSKAQLLDLIRTVGLEVIGEDEIMPDARIGYDHAQNELRAAQKQRLNELMGKEK